MKLPRSDQSELIQILKTTDFSHSPYLKPSLQLDSDQDIISSFHSQESCIFKEQLTQKLETEIEQLGLELNSPVMRNTIQKKTGSSKKNNPMQLKSNKAPSEAKLPEQVRFHTKNNHLFFQIRSLY